MLPSYNKLPKKMKGCYMMINMCICIACTWILYGALYTYMITMSMSLPNQITKTCHGNTCICPPPLDGCMDKSIYIIY